MTIQAISAVFGRNATNRLNEAFIPTLAGALALVETFYFAFNQRDLEVFRHIWAEDEGIQLNNPVGGILRGHEAITALYTQIFRGPARVWVELHDITIFASPDFLVCAGRELGAYERDGEQVPLTIRTTRVVQWLGPAIGWRQVHHHGSIDDAAQLVAYQRAVRGSD